MTCPSCRSTTVTHTFQVDMRKLHWLDYFKCHSCGQRWLETTPAEQVASRR